MTGRLLCSGLLSVLLLDGCVGLTDKGVFGTGGNPQTLPDNSDDSSGGGGDDSTGGGDSGGGDSGGSTSEASFDDPGDVLAYEDDDGVAKINLADASGDTNLDQEFYMVFVDTGSSSMTYRLRYTDTGTVTSSSMRRPEASSPRLRAPPTRARARLRDAVDSGALLPVAPPAVPPPGLSLSDVGVTEQEFRVRDDLEDDSDYALVDATLWAVGDSVAIWVDNDVPIDWDYECDGVVDEEDHYPAYGFDNCDLQTIADIVDSNIFPNISALYGDVSDLNGDGLVSVVITPELNYMPLTSSDESDYGGVVESYADPEVDLTDWDADSNPGSNEQEVIYVFAPDPYGYYNSLASTTIDEYTSMSLASQIARSYEGLISYNQHKLVNGGDSEESWADAAFGSLAADLVGFGAVYYDDAWKYMDAPYLNGLTTTEEEGVISSEPVGAQYLFARWLVDAYGTDILASLLQTSSTGTDAVEEATGADFADLVVAWQVALLTTGVTTADGSTLVTDTDYAPYADSTTLSAPTSDPVTGDYYGANGYQQGINIHGINAYMEGGTTDTPAENEDDRVTLENTDHFIDVTGLEFYGAVEGNYGAQVVRLTSLPYAGTGLRIQGSDSGFVGAVVRWNDISSSDVAVEDIFSSTDANDLDLPTLPSGEGEIYAVGSLSTPGITSIVSADGSETTEVPDTDRWLIDLTDRSGEVPLAIWMTRRYGEDGDVSLSDPWMAVVPSSYVPTPTVDGTTSGTCSGGVTFEYPSSILEYLYYQVFLSSDPFTADDTTFDACGTVSTEATTCAEDWDLDGVADADEPEPTTFQEQVWVMQCTQAGGDSSAFSPEGTDIIDEDSTDDDSDSTYDMPRNLGGTTDGSTEDAYLEITLEGGQEYILVVGDADESTGTYELTIHTLTD